MAKDSKVEALGLVEAFQARNGGWTQHRVLALRELLDALAGGQPLRLVSAVVVVWEDSFVRIQPGPNFHLLPQSVQDWVMAPASGDL